MKTLFYNAHITTMRSGDPEYSCLGMENGKIIYLADKEPEEKYDRREDLHGAYVYPTLCDSHLHLLYSIILSACSFNICRIENGAVVPGNLAGIEASIRSYAEKNPGRFLIVNSYIPSAIEEKRLPFGSELEEWTGGREAVVFNIDGHSCSLSTALSKKLGIKTVNGILSGVEYDHNQGIITGYAAKIVDLPLIAKGVAEFQNACLRYGITKVCAMDGDNSEKKHDLLLDLLVLLARRMDIDVRLYPEYINYVNLPKYWKKMKHRRVGGCSAWELDGSVGSHSAAFANPYKDTGTRAEKYYEDGFVKAKLAEALERGAVTSAHAIGTLAIDQLVDAYESNRSKLPKTGPMVRIDHFEFPSERANAFVMQNPVGLTVQPGYAYIDKRYIHSYSKHMDERDLQRIVPLKELSDGGALLLGSSDSPVQDINPYEQMRGMTDYYVKEQSLSRYAALRTYTSNASRVLGDDDGELYVGGPATFFVTKTDLLTADEDVFIKTTAERVYLRGKRLRPKSGKPSNLLPLLLKPAKKI